MMMGFPLKVTTPSGDESREPYILRVAGWTEARYFKEAPETRLAEFEDGEVIMHSPAGTRHQQVVAFLTFLLRGYVRARDLGEVLNGPAVVRLRPGLAYEPDIFVVGRDQLGQLGEQYLAGAPALVVEVVSSGTRSHDLKTKATAYRKHRVKEYWAVDPEQRILARYRPSAHATAAYRVTRHATGRLTSAALPGFWVEASWLWQASLPSEVDCLDQILGRVATRKH